MNGTIAAFIAISVLVQQLCAQPQRDIFSFDEVRPPSVTIGGQDRGISKHNGNEIPAVEINLYYEAFCPACKMYFKQELYTAYQKLGRYLKIELLPYGNTRESPDTDTPGKS